MHAFAASALRMRIGLLRGGIRVRVRASPYALGLISYFPTRNMSKRKTTAGIGDSPSKRVKPEIPEYHLTPSICEDDGTVQWPAPRSAMQRAREIILEAAAAKEPIVILPDKDADGLSAGAILRHTLLLLGLPESLIHVHLLKKGTTIHDESERTAMRALSPKYIFVVDQGSRSGPPLIDDDHVGLIIDHHHATPADFPDRSEHVTACDSPPVATSALLTYEICKPLHERVAEKCSWLCVVGTHGDLGNTLKWAPPFPDMNPILKQHTKKVLHSVVSLVNAPRRTSTFDVRAAWDALSTTDDPKQVLTNPRLLEARAEVNAEVERCTHTPPKFTVDGRVAVFRINSPAQVHPVIATRWAGHLSSKALEIVMVANEGYLPGKVNFSCRIARCARARDPPVDIIASLKQFADLPDIVTPAAPADASADDIAETPVIKAEEEEEVQKAPLIERLGQNFARGHVQASGGIVNVDEFEELMRRMQVGVKPDRGNVKEKESPNKSRKVIDTAQSNTLTRYFGKSAAAAK